MAIAALISNLQESCGCCMETRGRGDIPGVQRRALPGPRKSSLRWMIAVEETVVDAFGWCVRRDQ